METKMLGKRRLGDTTSSSPKFAKTGDEDTVESSAKPVYVLAAHMAEHPRPQLAHSAFLIDADAVAEPPVARTLGRLARAGQGMSFVAVHSMLGSWIVGVGGPKRRAIIYDPSTQETIRAPNLSRPKVEPVLISHGGKVYAISRRPKVRRDSKSDFVPWFQSLNFNEAVPCIHHANSPRWRNLPPPPFFPCLLSPSEYRNPPNVSVSSFAAVGSHILLSLEQEACGTYAFHVKKKTWEKVLEKNLPFAGQAVPVGDNLFACRVVVANIGASVVLMYINISTPVIPGTTSSLSIQKFPVALNEDPLLLLYPLGKGSFCSIKWVASSHQSNKVHRRKGPQIMLTTFHINNTVDILAACQTEAKNLHVAVHVKQQNRTYRLKGQPKFLFPRAPVVVSLNCF